MPDVFPGDYGVPDVPSWIDDWVRAHLNPPRVRRTSGDAGSEPGAPSATPPRRNYPTSPGSGPSQAPRPRPGLPQAPLTAGFVPQFVVGSLLMNFVNDILGGLRDPNDPIPMPAADWLEKVRKALLTYDPRGQGPTRRYSRGAPRAAYADQFTPPPQVRAPSVAPGNPGPSESRRTSTSPMAAAASAPGMGSQPTTAPVAPGNATTAPARADPFARTRAILAKPKAPPKLPDPWYTPWIEPFKELVETELKLLVDRPGLKRGRSSTRPDFFEPERPTVPETPLEESPLTGFQPYGVGYDTAVDECGVKKRKPGKPRTVCYSGKYREKARGLTKSKGRKIPCRQ